VSCARRVQARRASAGAALPPPPSPQEATCTGAHSFVSCLPANRLQGARGRA
jgi:hypothetical protein